VKEVRFFQTKAFSDFLHFEAISSLELSVLSLFMVVLYFSIPFRNNEKRTVPLLLAVSASINSTKKFSQKVPIRHFFSVEVSC